MSGQVKTDASLSRELQDIRHALDVSAIVAITDRAGKILHVNDKFCEISKYSREELLGQNHRIINSGYHSSSFFAEMWKTISSGQRWEGEIRNRAKDGSLYWVNTAIVPFVDDQGSPSQYIAIRYDITQRKNAEQQLRVYADRLEQSNRELQDFASIAAHDLQEPLRKIQAFGDRLGQKYGDALQEEGRDYLERMLKSSVRMRRLIDDLLTYSRVTTKARPFTVTDLNGVVKEVLADLEIRVEQTQAQITVGNLPKVDADSSQMHQLFLNLIGNGLKFFEKGKIPVVHVQGRRDGDSVVLEVIDQGIGFDTKYLSRIFTIFQRLHGKQEYEGTGVGLAVCRRIVERHGGTLTAESSEGKGACFRIRMPVSHGRLADWTEGEET